MIKGTYYVPQSSSSLSRMVEAANLWASVSTQLKELSHNQQTKHPFGSRKLPSKVRG